jgi:PAS domain S-box-containing protein
MRGQPRAFLMNRLPDASDGAELFRRVADSAPVLMWMTGPDGRAVWLNRPWLEFTGRDLEEELGDGWTDGIHPADVAAYQRTFNSAFDARRPFQLDHRLRRHDDTYHWVLNSGMPMTGPNGEFTGFIGSCVDINDRREAAARNAALLVEVSRRSRQLDLLSWASRQVNAVLDAPVILRRLVAGGRELTDAAGGYAGLVTDGRLTAEEYDDRGALRPAALSAGPSDKGVPRYVLRSRSPYIADDAAHDAVVSPELRERFAVRNLIALPILDRGGQVVAYFELHNKRGSKPFDPDDLRALEGLAAAAAVALDNARLLKQVQDADRRKEEYLAMLAHELRNPLAPIRNALHVIDQPSPDPDVLADARRTIRRQVTHLTGIVDDLLDVSRAHKGGLTIRRERVDLGAVAAKAVVALESAAAEASVTVFTDLPDDGEPVWVDGDPDRLLQVFENLIHNAIKYTPQGGEVRVSLAAGEGWAVARVRDTGIGMAPEMIPRLFEVFSQADRSLDRARGGLGLGLALVKGLVDLHGGNVTAESRGLGHGSAFTVRLPMTRHPAGSKPDGKCQRVLVVEDSRDAADTMRMLLDMSGYEVTVAYTGPDGLAMAQTDLPDVVVCDIGLPGITGYEIAAALRSDPATRGIRLLAVTGYGRPEDIRQARESGFDDHMTKPVDPQDLLRWLGPPVAQASRAP